ncbi:hypothetical protein OO010_15595 [Flavobacteriaceae bacterium KMM 6898]|nr:hypothetical protein [Flavobacteriaceae bacterium KMM 6898]
MNKLIQIGLIGLLISFLGSLPLGTLNITAFQIAVFQDVPSASWFAMAVVLIELLMVRITLKWSGTIDLRNRFFFYTLPIAALILFYLSISSFMSISEDRELSTSLQLIPMIKSSFVLGLLLSVLNPMHIPFWMGWNNILIERKRLDKARGMQLSYMVGIGLGSMGGFMIFILLGKYIFQNLNQYNYIIAFIMGCIYLGFSFYMLFALYKNHLKLTPS